jgi:hypothetical protein
MTEEEDLGFGLGLDLDFELGFSNEYEDERVRGGASANMGEGVEVWIEMGCEECVVI